MQQLLEDVTGRDFPSLATELVLGPAGMRDSTFAQPLPAALADVAATGHHPGPVPVPGRWHTYPEMAAAGLWSTAPDLARFFLAIRESLAATPGALLPRHVAEQMVVPAVDGTPYGLGVRLGPAPGPASIGHGGNDQGFENYAVLYTDRGQGVVVMTNSFYGSVLIREAVVPALTEAYGWQQPTTAPASPAPNGPARYGDFLVQPSGADLMLTFAGQSPVRLSCTSDGRWQARSVNVDVWFDDDTLVVEQDGGTVRTERQRDGG
jgi:CubicO group peptidase (beta-lactamase class C family)